MRASGAAEMPVVALPDWAVLVLNVAGFAGTGAVAGYIGNQIPVERLGVDGWLLRPRRWEQGGRFYERRLRIRWWKHRIPDAGALFVGGIRKAALPGGRRSLPRFAAETRRAELVHWWAAAAVPPFLLWNPVVGWPILGAAVVALHAVPIVVQRYNRLRILRILGRRSSG